MAPHMRVVLVVRPGGRRWWWVCDQRRDRTPVLTRYYNMEIGGFWGNFIGLWFWVAREGRVNTFWNHGEGQGQLQHLFEPRRATEGHGERQRRLQLLLSTEGHGGPRRTATATATSTPLSTKGHEGPRRAAKNCNFNTFCPRRATEGHGELRLQWLHLFVDGGPRKDAGGELLAKHLALDTLLGKNEHGG